MLSLLDENVVHDISQGASQKGVAAFDAFLKRMDQHYDERLDQFVIMVNEDGTRGAAEFVCHGTYKATDAPLPPAKGQKYSIPVGAFFEIKNNKIARISNHYNLNEWIKMVQG